MPRHEPQLQLFGAPGLASGGALLHDLPDSLPGFVTAYLAWRADWLNRESLAGLLWPDRTDADAQRNLRVNLHRVRGLLQVMDLDQAFEADRRRVRLCVSTDVAAFRGALGRADWQQATALQRAPFLEGFSFRGFALLEAWALRERDALTDAWQAAALKFALQAEQSGHAEQAADLLLRLADAGGTEDVIQALLRVAPAAGRVTQALAAYERLGLQLHEELGLAPAAETRQLAHELKGERLDVSPARLVSVVPAVPRAIEQPPRLVGRDAERARVADADIRVLLIGGEPGVGKTRLLEDAWPGARWLSCREGLEGVPFAPVTEYLSDHQQGLPDLGPFRLDLARLLPALADGELLPPADPLTTRSRVLEAVAHVLSAGAPAIVVDDLQWADAATRDLLLHLARRPGPPLRLAYRIDELTPALEALFDALDATQPVQRLVLQPLSAAALTELLADLARAPENPFGGSPGAARTKAHPLQLIHHVGRLGRPRRALGQLAQPVSGLPPHGIVAPGSTRRPPGPPPRPPILTPEPEQHHAAKQQRTHTKDTGQVPRRDQPGLDGIHALGQRLPQPPARGLRRVLDRLQRLHLRALVETDDSPVPEHPQAVQPRRPAPIQP